VRGDIVVLYEGDRVPADGILLSSINLSIDESLLTGESVPVRKKAGGEGSEMERAGGEGTPFVYSSTLCRSWKRRGRDARHRGWD